MSLPGLRQGLTHAQRVTRLYRSILINVLSCCNGDRMLFVEVGREIQAEFRKNKDIKDPFLAEKLVKEAEAIHADWQHPYPIIRFKHNPEGNVYQRYVPHPLEMCTDEPPWARSHSEWWQDYNQDLKKELGQEAQGSVWRTLATSQQVEKTS
eukprot:Rmarinus@m.13090